jgi:hypothetical protein
MQANWWRVPGEQQNMKPQFLSDVDFYRDLGPVSRELTTAFGAHVLESKSS